MLNLYVFDASLAKIPAFVREASEADLRATSSWQTNWTSKYVKSLPNKVALCRRDDGELLGLMEACWQLRLSILKARLIVMQICYAQVLVRKSI